jgi:hypothetical protein
MLYPSAVLGFGCLEPEVQSRREQQPQQEKYDRYTHIEKLTNHLALRIGRTLSAIFGATGGSATGSLNPTAPSAAQRPTLVRNMLTASIHLRCMPELFGYMRAARCSSVSTIVSTY